MGDSVAVANASEVTAANVTRITLDTIGKTVSTAASPALQEFLKSHFPSFYTFLGLEP